MIRQKSGTVVPSCTSALEEMSSSGTFSPKHEAVIQNTAGALYATGSDTACFKIIGVY